MTITEIKDFLDLNIHARTVESKLDLNLPSKCVTEKEGSLFMRKNCEINARKKIYRCVVCDLSFKSLKNIGEHVLKSHTRTMRHTCESCSKSFPTAKRLENHKVCHQRPQDYTCGVCRKGYTNRKAFTKHIWSHENLPKQFVCEECGKIFPNRERLKTHSRVHSGEKPFPCETCSSCFATAFQLKLHSRVHSGERPHSCDVCGKGFAAACGLQQHKRTHTKESPYSCDYCGNQFRQMEKLKQHLRIHTDSRPFMCDRCPKTFRIKAALTRHLRIHSGETYKCVHCVKNFTELYALKRHHRLRHIGLEFTGAAVVENDTDDQTALSSTAADDHALEERNGGDSAVDSEFNLKPKSKMLSDSHSGYDFPDRAFMQSGDAVSQSVVFENGWTRIPLGIIGSSQAPRSHSLQEDDKTAGEIGQRERENLQEHVDGEIKKHDFIPDKERQQYTSLPTLDDEISAKTRPAATSTSEQTADQGHISHSNQVHHGHTHTIRYFPDSAVFQTGQDQAPQSRLLELSGPSSVTERTGSVPDYYYQGLGLHQETTGAQNVDLYHSPSVAGRKLYDLNSDCATSYPPHHLALASHNASVSAQGCAPGLSTTGFLDQFFPQHQSFQHSQHQRPHGLDQHQTQHALDQHQTQHGLDQHQTQHGLDQHQTQHALDQHQTQHGLDQHQTPHGLDQHQLHSSHPENCEADLQRNLHLQQPPPPAPPPALPQCCQQQKLCHSEMAVNNASVYSVNQVLHEASSMKSQQAQGTMKIANSENQLHQQQPLYQQVYTYYDQFSSQDVHQAESQDRNMEKGLPYFTPSLSYGQAQRNSAMAQSQHRHSGLSRMRSLGHSNTQAQFESFTPYLGSNEQETAGTVVHHKPALCEPLGGQRLPQSQKNTSHCEYSSQLFHSSQHEVSQYGKHNSHPTLQARAQVFERTPQTNLPSFFKMPSSGVQVQVNKLSYRDGEKKHAENATGCPNKDIHLLTNSKRNEQFCLYLDGVGPTTSEMVNAQEAGKSSLDDEVAEVVMNAKINTSGSKENLSKRVDSHHESVRFLCASENAESKGIHSEECSLEGETSEGACMTDCENEGVQSSKVLMQVDEQYSLNTSEAGELHGAHGGHDEQSADAEKTDEKMAGRNEKHDAEERKETNVNCFQVIKSEEVRTRPRRHKQPSKNTTVGKADMESSDCEVSNLSNCSGNSDTATEQKYESDGETHGCFGTNDTFEKLKQVAHVEKYYKYNASKQQYQCLICTKSQKTASLLEKHVLVTHFDKGKPKCHKCRKIFPQIYRLRRHLLTHNPGKPFSCHLCRRTFKLSETLEKHMQTCLKKAERCFVCTECNKSFPTAYQLKVHFRTHSGEKPYACSYCSEKFATSFQVRQHERVHTGLRPYKCSMCTKAFASNSGLVTHIKYHTGEKPFLCASCGAAFQEASKLRAHARIHTGAHPFMCDRCPKRFKVKHLLVRHMRWHTGDLFHCHQCGKDFDEKYILKAHIGKQHSSSSAN